MQRLPEVDLDAMYEQYVDTVWFKTLCKAADDTLQTRQSTFWYFVGEISGSS